MPPLSARQSEQPLAPELEAPTPPENAEVHLPEEFGAGIAGRLLFWIAIAFATFQIVTAFGIPLNRDFGFGLTAMHLAGAGLLVWVAAIARQAWRGGSLLQPLLALLPMLVVYLLLLKFAGGVPSQVLRTLHVAFLCLLAAGMLADSRAQSPPGRMLWWGAGGLAFAAGLYHWALYRELVTRAGHVTGPDLVVGCVAVVILVLLVWRVLGPALPLVAGIFLAYTLVGQILPSPLNHRGYDFS